MVMVSVVVMAVVIERGNGRLINWNVMCLQGRKEETEGAERLWPGGLWLFAGNLRGTERRKRNRRGRKEGTTMVAVHGRQRKGGEEGRREKPPPPAWN